MIRFEKKLYNFTKQHVKDLLAYNVKDRARYSKDEHLKLLLTASLVNGFAEGVSRSLSNSPTGETLLSYIKSQEQETLQKVFDGLVEQNVKTLRRRRKLFTKVPIAIDWHDVMYYGDPETPMVNGTCPKNGSCHAYQYLTASVISDGERLVVAVIPLEARKCIFKPLKCILRRLEILGIKILYVTLDGGFFNIDTMKFLEESKLRYIVHMPCTTGIKKKRLWNGRRFHYTTNSHRKGTLQQASFDVVVAYDKKKKYRYLFATNMPYKAETILELYSKRWGIETSYRICNQFLIKTTSKNYTVRLFYYLLACIVYNAWVLYNDDNEITVVQMKLSIIGFVMNYMEGKDT